MIEKLINVQKALKAPKNQRNNFGGYNYRSCEDILEAVKPLLAKEGLLLTITDEVFEVGGRVYVRAVAEVTDGGKSYSVAGFAREEETRKGMDASQITGAASSYARKYALNGLFLIDDTKDADATNTHGKVVEKEEEPLPNIICEKCGSVIMSYENNGKMIYPAKHAEGSKKKFGQVLCMKCINEMKA